MRATLAAVATLLLVSPPAPGAARGTPGVAFSAGWTRYVVSGTHPVLGLPATVTPAEPATIVWPHEVAGSLRLTFGSVTPGSVVRVAFSETAEYLGVGGTSDWSRTYLTDDHAATSGETWQDGPGCQAPGVCADGYRAFRFARVFVDRGSAAVAAASVVPAVRAPPPAGWFLSSDRQLNRIWFASAYTAELSVLPAEPDLLGTRCTIPAGTAPELVVDGAKRDRCPWVADLAVEELSLLLAGGDSAAAPVEGTLSLFAAGQGPDGALPASPMAVSTLFDYPAYFVLAVDELMLYRGDLPAVARYWPAIVGVLDSWYPGFAEAGGLLADPYPQGNYAYVDRGAGVDAYDNSLYARALEAAAGLADVLGHGDAAARWRARAAALAPAFEAAFWDAPAGAFRDTPEATVHPQDGNAFAVLSGLASPAEARSAFAYLDRTTRRPWGNALADVDAWAAAPCDDRPSQCVFPFVSYFDVDARFAAGDDATALDELRRTWGWMLGRGGSSTGTTWEAIGAGGTVDGYERAASSLASGWSSGAAPALTNDLLGIRPTGPGFSTFDAIPHPAGVAWAQGRVPTPAGAITFGFRRTATGYVLRLEAPSSLTARVGAPVPDARVLVDGRAVAPAADGTVTLRGSHVVEFRRG